jgi:hypothetical protein
MVWTNEKGPAASRQGGKKNTETAGLLAIAGVVVLLHMLTNGRYGFHRDELQFLSDARHPEWGFVAYPDERAHTGILVGNYGEAGAVEILGP